MGLEVATDFISTELVPQSLTFCPHTFPSSEANRPSWQRWSAGQKTDDAKGARTSPASEVSGSETPNTWQDRAQKHYQAKISWKKTKNKTQISWGIALSYWNSEEPQGGWVSAVTVPAEESKWHQLRRNLAGRNLLILCHLHPFSQKCQLSALELFQFSSFCLCCTGLQSFSCRRKPCSHCHSRVSHTRKCPWHRCWYLSGAQLFIPWNCQDCWTCTLAFLCTYEPPHLMGSLPPCISVCPHTARTTENSFVPRQKRGYAPFQWLKLLKKIGRASFGFICIFIYFLLLWEKLFQVYLEIELNYSCKYNKNLEKCFCDSHELPSVRITSHINLQIITGIHQPEKRSHGISAQPPLALTLQRAPTPDRESGWAALNQEARVSTAINPDFKRLKPHFH